MIFTRDIEERGYSGSLSMVDPNLKSACSLMGLNLPVKKCIVMGYISRNTGKFCPYRNQGDSLRAFEIISRESVLVDNTPYARLTFIVPDNFKESVAYKVYHGDGVFGGYEYEILKSTDPI